MDSDDLLAASHAANTSSRAAFKLLVEAKGDSSTSRAVVTALVSAASGAHMFAFHTYEAYLAAQVAEDPDGTWEPKCVNWQPPSD